MSEEQVKQFIDQATQSLQGGNFEEALNLVEQAIALDERASEAHVLKGIALSQLSRPDDATAAFRNAIMHGPYNAKAYFNLAVHYYALGQEVQAEEMAREAVRIDPKHGGARELVSRIESGRKPQSGVGVGQGSTPYPGDPLSDPNLPPPGTSGPLPGQPMTPQAPSGGPQQPVSPEQPSAPQQPYGAAPQQPYGAPQQPYGAAPTPQGYYRPGYESAGVHSLRFVENMGKTWDTIGIVLGVAMLAMFIVSLFMSMGMVTEMMRNPQSFQNNPNLFTGGGNIVLSILYYPIMLGSWVWLIMDIVDRKSNWLWVLPYFICCCCSLQGVVQLIYIFKGRNN